MWTPGSFLIQVEAELHRAELLRAAQAQQRISRTLVSLERSGPPWRIGVGRGLMRLGARLAGIEVPGRAPAL